MLAQQPLNRAQRAIGLATLKSRMRMESFALASEKRAVVVPMVTKVVEEVEVLETFPCLPMTANSFSSLLVAFFSCLARSFASSRSFDRSLRWWSLILLLLLLLLPAILSESFTGDGRG
uniref:Uncharacterized protein n=1 Tax=Anopheles melas TaxID=34690 RepID=A0A182U5L3_9DIPT